MINREIENFQLSRTLKAFREKLGYPSRKKSRLETWPYIIKQNVVPFQRTVAVPIKRAPLFTHFPRFMPPPLIGEGSEKRFDDITFEPIWMPNDIESRDREWTEIRREYIESGAHGQVSVDGPPFNWFASVRFFAKIALGFAYVINPRDRSREPLARMVLDREIARTKWSKCLYSLPKTESDAFVQGESFLGENGTEYVCFEVLPEINKEVYFTPL